MKVAVYYKNNDIRLEERRRPEIGEGELLVKVRASGICGTDLMEWYRIKKAPRVLGHEMTGEIAESKSPKYKIGQRVFVSHHVPCDHCKFCLEGNHTACETLHQGNYDPGGYSEFVRVPRLNVEKGTYVLPEGISYEAGTLIEPLACALRAQRVINVKAGQTVLILGSGISGLLNIRVAKLMGARVLATDLDPFRRQKAKESGADEVLDARQPLRLEADRVIVCAGALEAVKQAFECVARKGVVLLFAIPSVNVEIPTLDFWRNEVTVTSSYGAAPRDLAESLALLRDRKMDVEDLITHRLPFENIQEGFHLASGAGTSLKVILRPSALSQ
ncbi:MAG: alcohol dehydrogenase catalytic domain-containing protein [Candidatus Omnitrophica bacterium]|nr:alcohol dehydrogenase catalytic domain-containing protein [Candidatus Omnitrophota bacterium]